MASSSSAVDEDEEAMWNRLLQVERDILRNQLFQAGTLTTILQKTEEMFIKTAKEGFAEMKDRVVELNRMDFKISNDDFITFEEIQVDSPSIGPRMYLLLNSSLVFDRQRKCESRFLKLLWKNSNGILDDDLLLSLSKLAEHYSHSHEVENLEFVLTNEERVIFLKDCSFLDNATRLAKDFNEFSLRPTKGQKPLHWTRRDHTLHSVSSFESLKPLEVVFPFSTRFETAKECLDRLDLLKSVTMDLKLDECDTVASVLNSFKSPELQALHALKKEMELHGEVAFQLEQLNNKHLQTYKELSKDQHESLDEFFRISQEEKRNVVQEALYKKVKCLASIKKASISRQVKLSSEDILKGILQKAGSAFKEVEGKLKKVQSSEEVRSKECTLCYSEFSKKRKRACLDPCGHASACINCATKAWAKKPYCPWCKASIQKPIPIPEKIFL